MKKSEFMKQENVPQFIKDLIADAPEDVEIGFKSLNLSDEVPVKKGDKQSNKCENCQHKNTDGINIGPHIEVIYTQLKELGFLADCEGYIALENAEVASSILDLMESSIDYLDDYICSQKNRKGKKA